MTLPSFLLYLVAVLVLTVTPGPSVLMCVTNGVHYGSRRAWFGALGSVTAVSLIMSVSVLGLGAILAVSEKVFLILKWGGVCYLAYIGVRTFFSTHSAIALAPQSALDHPDKSRTSLYWQGFLVGGSNPKALLFFTAFFPQFINSDAARLPQFLLLGAVFVCLELFWLMFYAHFASRAAPWLRAPGRATMFNRLVGATFIGASSLLATVRR
jgi:threonine/homoserine/homoserine lactone efflux protein